MRFDAVLAANVLERLPDPALFLDQLEGLVQPNGIAVLASAFSWSEHDTPKDNWLGGFYKVRYYLGSLCVKCSDTIDRLMAAQ